jgi:hypothetical protein
MSTNQRFHVALNLHGRVQYYSRDSESMVEKRWRSVPQFVIEISKASPMLEATAISLVQRLRSLKEDPWLVSTEGQRVDVTEDGQPPFTEDNRVPMRATLDSDAAVANGTAKWYIVRPARSPMGLKWVLNYNLPGRPPGDQIYRDTALECLERAAELHVLQHGEVAPAPEAPRPAPVQQAVGPRVRPGDRR